jgi:dTDP-4-dehydrorhamnose 3,5-epimerase-like enzyme
MRPKHSLLELPKRSDARGNLIFAQDRDHIPFPVKRFFLLYGLCKDATRGGHAHRAQHQLLMMTAGGATVTVDDGQTRTPIRLDNPAIALHVPPMLWLDLEDFSEGAACLVLTSDVYSEKDYIRERNEFLRLAAN